MRMCDICGKGPVAGRSYSQRGVPKKKGGVGRRTTRKNKRLFLPNLQRVKAIVHGTITRLRVCTACLKNGRVTKAPRLPRNTDAPRRVTA
ncbi:MAG: 50S ribosomal protein L28 [Candidatus Omnitrophica bacterium]|nr:50S ribosomal protein L28 [Candidatus Omnitrophota bacterium]